MRRLFLILAVCACVVSASIQSVNAQTTRIKASTNYVTRDIPNFGRFDAICTEGSVDVEYTQSTDGTVSVKKYGSDNVLDYIEVFNDAGTLVARTRNNLNIKGKSKLKVIVSGPALKKVDSTGSSDIYLMGNINTGDLAVQTAGSGDMKFNTITCDNLKFSSAGSGDLRGRSVTCTTVDISTAGSGDVDIDHVAAPSVKLTSVGSSDIRMAGKATDVVISSSGSGYIDVINLPANTVKATAMGSGNISCYATRRLDATAVGSLIYFGGKPAMVNITGNTRSVRTYYVQDL